MEINIFRTGGGKKAARELNVCFFGSIPFEMEIVKSGDVGLPYIQFQKDTKTAQALQKIIQNVTQQVTA